MWNKYIMRLVRLIIGVVFKPTWMPQAPKGETVRETVTLAVRAHTWNARWRSVVCLLMFVALLFTIWQAAERFWPRSPAPQSLLQPPPFPLALDDPGSVLAVKGSLRRFAPWTAPDRSGGRRCSRGERGELRAASVLAYTYSCTNATAQGRCGGESAGADMDV